MKKRWAFLLAFIMLGLGALAGFLYATVIFSVVTFSMSCSLLDTAESAGYLTPQQRGDLLDKVIAKEGLNLDAQQREALARLKTKGCGS